MIDIKIRTKLIIAFFIMTFFPLVAGIFCFNKTMQQHAKLLSSYYNIDADSDEVYTFMLNPIGKLYNLTFKDYLSLVETADTNPDTFLDYSTLKRINLTLEDKDSYLIVRYNNLDYYTGNRDYRKNIDSLPYFSSVKQGYNNTVILSQGGNLLIRYKNFYFSDGASGQIFMVTRISRYLSQWKTSLLNITLSFMIIILYTAIALILWLNDSILKPLNILKIATVQIGAGELNNKIEVTSSDEIGQLCQDFEEMRIRLKSILEERIQYEQATREMISCISHDLKTPLTAIKGYSEGLIDGIASTPEKQKNYLLTILSKATDMTYLVDEMSLFSKLEQNALPYNFVSFDIDSYMQEYILSQMLDLEAKNICVHYENLTPPGTAVIADALALKRVLSNIVSNTVKYMDKPEGEIHITITDLVPPPVEPPLYRQINEDGTDVEPPQIPDEFIQIAISDNGPGIDKKDLPHIFDKFFRADASRNSSKSGSGIGLCIVKNIIAEHGGTINAESTLGSGTNIYFTLRKKVGGN